MLLVDYLTILGPDTVAGPGVPFAPAEKAPGAFPDDIRAFRVRVNGAARRDRRAAPLSPGVQKQTSPESRSTGPTWSVAPAAGTDLKPGHFVAFLIDPVP
ncbi:hypothetical protein [Actinoplanes sp. NPDC051851]|uniref:hypothetical protein n=1 Tax=Actinoplanes sp. NPDC051851 TaxID=3154753 RepID=UPI00343DD289